MCIFYFWGVQNDSKWLLERDRDHVKKAEKAECLERPQTDRIWNSQRITVAVMSRCDG